MLDNQRKNIVVVGGGTSGWLSALYLKKYFPNFEITVIESEEIGILGAGEGTVPNIINILQELDIDYTDVINFTNGTIKLGVKFENWSGDNQHYYHSFVTTNPTISEVLSSSTGKEDRFLTYGMIANDILIGKNTPAAISCEKNKLPFINVDGKLIPVGHFALHFDAKLFATFLKKVAISRGVMHIEGVVSNIELDNNDFISSIKLKDEKIIHTDFVLDCSGFQKLIIGKLFKSKWKSYKEFLPADSAIGFFLESEKLISPYTTALAMKYGWLWKIPLQNRTGCGYVFDSSKIDTESAIKEIKKTLGISKVDVQKIFKFESGCYEKTWIKNCVALGLSSSFIEPLEATSIMTLINSLEIFKDLFLSYNKNNCKISNIYNKKILNLNNQILKFIHIHYISCRSDTEFWTCKQFKNKKLLKNLTGQIITSSDETIFDIFGYLSWLIVLQGNHNLSKDPYEKFLDLHNLRENWVFEYGKYSKNVQTVVDDLVQHNLYLELIKN